MEKSRVRRKQTSKQRTEEHNKTCSASAIVLKRAGKEKMEAWSRQRKRDDMSKEGERERRKSEKKGRRKGGGAGKCHCY